MIFEKNTIQQNLDIRCHLSNPTTSHEPWVVEPTCKEELESAVNDLTSDKVQLQTTMDLLDGALRTLEDLKPQCVDSTMSYEERKAGTFS